MSRKLVKLSLKALDEYDRLINSQELLYLALEQMQSQSQSKDKSKDKRVELLIVAYLSLTSLYLNELTTALENIRRQARANRDRQAPEREPSKHG